MAEKAGDDVVEPHTEEGTGHEELYFVARGSATFTLDGETVHAPAGTYVFLPDPAVHRHAVADEPGTAVLLLRRLARPRVRGLELGGALPRRRDPRAGSAAGARALRGGARGRPDDKWGLYDFACWHALYGDEAEARRLLDRAIELGGDEVREQAAKDPDLERLR